MRLRCLHERLFPSQHKMFCPISSIGKCAYTEHADGPGWCVWKPGYSGAQADLCNTDYGLGSDVRGNVTAANPQTCTRMKNKPVSESEAQDICNSERNCAGYVVWKAPHASKGTTRLASQIKSVFKSSGGEHCFVKQCGKRL